MDEIPKTTKNSVKEVSKVSRIDSNKSSKFFSIDNHNKFSIEFETDVYCKILLVILLLLFLSKSKKKEEIT